MKKILSMLLICLSVTAMAQNRDVFKRVVKECKASQKMVMQVDSDLFELYLKKQTASSKKVMEDILKGVDNLNILQFVADSETEKLVRLNSIRKNYEKGGWKLFKEGVDANNRSYIVLKRNRKNIGGVAYMGTDGNRVSLLEFLGDNIQLTKIAKLSDVMNLQGVEKLSELTGSKAGKIHLKVVQGHKIENQPLYIIDNVVASADELKKVATDDIESMSILKNKSATAIYGNKAVDGVIIVTTKNKGKLKRSLEAQNCINTISKGANGVTITRMSVEASKKIRESKGAYIDGIKNGSYIGTASTVKTNGNVAIIDATKNTKIEQNKSVSDGNLHKTVVNLSDLKIRVRGRRIKYVPGKGDKNNQPLYIINGKVVDNNNFAKIDLDQIETVEVLKGVAATKLYGEKAVNGAVIITIKK